MPGEVPNPAWAEDRPKFAAVKSAARVLEVLEFFDGVRRPSTVGEIAKSLGYPQSSTSILLKGLAELGYLDTDPKRRAYIPSLRVAALGSWLNEYLAPRGDLARLVDELSRETGHTVIVGSRSGLDSQYVQVVEATNAIRLHVAVGTRRVFVWSAVGFVLMARMADEDIRALVRRTNADMMPGRAKIDVAATLAKVESVRRRGYVYSRGLVTPAAGMICVALPTIDTPGARPLVVALAGAVEQFDSTEAELVRTLKTAVARNFTVTDAEAAANHEYDTCDRRG